MRLRCVGGPLEFEEDDPLHLTIDLPAAGPAKPEGPFHFLPE